MASRETESNDKLDSLQGDVGEICGLGSVLEPRNLYRWVDSSEGEFPQQDPCVCLLEHKQSPHRDISQEESQLSPLTDDLHWKLGRSSRDHWESNSADEDGNPSSIKT